MDILTRRRCPQDTPHPGHHWQYGTVKCHCPGMRMPFAEPRYEVYQMCSNVEAHDGHTWRDAEGKLLHCTGRTSNPFEPRNSREPLDKILAALERIAEALERIESVDLRQR